MSAFLNESLEDVVIIDLAWFVALGIVYDETGVVIRGEFLPDVRNATFTMGSLLYKSWSARLSFGDADEYSPRMEP